MATLIQVCGINDIPEMSSKSLVIAQLNILAVKKFGKVYLYKNQCPHLDIPLEWTEDQFLDSSRTMIQCASHGALFVIENGKCVAGPCVGRTLESLTYKVIDQNIFVADEKA